MSSAIATKESSEMIDRDQFLTTLSAAKACEEYQFMKQATMLWLANYPGDLHVQFLQALAYAGLDNRDQAISLLEGILEFDPNFLDAIKALSTLPENTSLQKYYQSITEFLKGQKPIKRIETEWLNHLYDARHAFYQSDLDKALFFAHQALVLEPPSAIPSIFHLQVVQKMENLEMLNNISDIHHARWPKCLQVNIIKAIADIDLGQSASGVERLHWVAAYDSAGQAIQRLLGRGHRFKDLWPESFEIYFDIPIPAAVNGYLGWNQLFSGLGNELQEKQYQKSMKFAPSNSNEVTRQMRVSNPTQNAQRKTIPHNKTDKDLEEVQKVFSKLAKRVKAPELDRADNRFPAYVIMSSKKQLEKIYGMKTAGVIDGLLHRLSNLVQNMEDWSSVVFYPDDVAQLPDLGLKPNLANDAWQVKLALNGFDAALAKRGEMIGALLIVGGPEIIPYHNLPNPTDDNDKEVPSDNPYSTIDENYFIPQWPVGRLPGETGSDPGLLLSQLRQIIHRYETGVSKTNKSIASLHSIIEIIVNFLLNLGSSSNNNLGLGYSAEIWRKSSALVYKNAGNSRELQLSPPVNSTSLQINKKPGHNIGYFNLHGVQDGPNWYGQKDFSSTSSGPDYPIALTPGMFNEQTPAPQITFTEACYGANVIDKQHEEALSLKFLDTGAQTFVGSTCISYGSVTPPLVSADYLAEKFWQRVFSGEAVGFALMKAKLSLVEEMSNTQGYLDGEDQKTVLSFVLFGDPLQIYEDNNAAPKPFYRVNRTRQIKTISDSQMQQDIERAEVPAKVNTYAKKIVEKYLPGLQNAELQYTKSYSTRELNQDKSFFTRFSTPSEHYLITLQKSFENNAHTKHTHFARMTFNKKGKLVKFTTSR
jgi:tetratricopeptide (TPR) repeat protein